MSKVLVIDTDKKPQNPIHPSLARQLLRSGKAAVFRRFPFTLILKDAKTDTVADPLRIKIDPGSKTTGLSLVNDATGEVVWAAELQHRGFAIREALTSRRQLRRGRRNRFIERTVTHMVHSVSDFWAGNKFPCSFRTMSEARGFRNEEVR